MRTVTTIVAVAVAGVVWGVSAGGACGATRTTAAQGALQLGLRLDLTTGAITIYNETGADVAVNGYEIWSPGGYLDPSGSAATGWVSICDVLNYRAHTGLSAAAWLGCNAALQDRLAREVDVYPVMGFVELQNTTTVISEYTFATADPDNGIDYGGEAIFRPGYANGWSIGHPMNSSALHGADLTFYYTKPSSPGDKYLGVIDMLFPVHDGPTAHANGPYTVATGDSLLLSAIGSMGGSDSWGGSYPIASIAWDLNDDGVFETSSGGSTTLEVSSGYLTSLGLLPGGPCDIHLRVTDSVGYSSTADTTLTITPEPATMSLLALGGLAAFRRRR